jgi:hypothetical protein
MLLSLSQIITKMETLADDILIEILSKLTFEEFMRIKGTCRAFNKFNNYIKCEMENYIYFSEKTLEMVAKYLMVEFKIKFKENDKSVDENVQKVAEYQNVKYVDLTFCHFVTNKSVKFLVNVHDLNLSNCYNITDESVKCLGNVECLNLCNCYLITDESVKYLGNVRRLNLYGCELITNECKNKLIEQGCPVFC